LLVLIVLLVVLAGPVVELGAVTRIRSNPITPQTPLFPFGETGGFHRLGGGFHRLKRRFPPEAVSAGSRWFSAG